MDWESKEGRFGNFMCGHRDEAVNRVKQNMSDV